MSEREIEIWGRPLEKMTTTELREAAKGIEGITGVHGMKKEELIEALRKSKGIVVEAARRASDTIRTLKKTIRSLKVKRAEALAAKDRTTAGRCRRQIARLKKKTRRLAA